MGNSKVFGDDALTVFLFLELWFDNNIIGLTP